MKLEEICDLLGGRLEGDPDLEIHGVNGIEEGREGEISFISHKKYVAEMESSQCSAFVAPEKITVSHEKAAIYVKNPHLAFVKLLNLFHPSKKEEPGISPQSFISKSAIIERDVTIYPMVYVGENTKICGNTVIHPGAFIGYNVKIGVECIVYANVSIYDGTVIGDRVVIHSGAVIGSDGFGYVLDEEGNRHKIPQVGNVVIEDEVEIGANTCIDRATVGETRILKGVKLDNLVQIAHNCVVGEDSVMAAQVGISGSCKIGKRVMMGGQVGMADHVNVGDDVMIVGQSGVPSDLEGKQIYAGSPTVKHSSWRKAQAALPKLPDLIKKARSMEKRIKELEKDD